MQMDADLRAIDIILHGGFLRFFHYIFSACLVKNSSHRSWQENRTQK